MNQEILESKKIDFLMDKLNIKSFYSVYNKSDKIIITEKFYNDHSLDCSFTSLYDAFVEGYNLHIKYHSNVVENFRKKYSTKFSNLKKFFYKESYVEDKFNYENSLDLLNYSFENFCEIFSVRNSNNFIYYSYDYYNLKKYILENENSLLFLGDKIYVVYFSSSINDVSFELIEAFIDEVFIHGETAIIINYYTDKGYSFSFPSIQNNTIKLQTYNHFGFINKIDAENFILKQKKEIKNSIN